MPVTFRPSNHHERDQVVVALKSWLARPDADPIMVALATALCLPAMFEYAAARIAWPERFAAARAASDAVDAADEAFDRDLRALSASVAVAAGRGQPRVLADMMGGTLASRLTRQPYREEIAKGAALVLALRDRPDLGVDSALLDRFEERVEALRESGLIARMRSAIASTLARPSADSSAWIWRLMFDSTIWSRSISVSCPTPQRASASAFDLGYGRMLRAFRAYAGERDTAAIAPRFVRPDEDDDEVVSVGAALTTLPLDLLCEGFGAEAASA